MLQQGDKKQLESSGMTHVEWDLNTGNPELQGNALPLDHNC